MQFWIRTHRGQPTGACAGHLSFFFRSFDFKCYDFLKCLHFTRLLLLLCCTSLSYSSLFFPLLLKFNLVTIKKSSNNGAERSQQAKTTWNKINFLKKAPSSDAGCFHPLQFTSTARFSGILFSESWLKCRITSTSQLGNRLRESHVLVI